MTAAEHILPLDPAHPNYVRWRRAVDAADQRGEFVADLIAAERSLSGAQVLDLGCGVGGASRVLRRRGARVFPADRNGDRLRYLRLSEPPAPAARLDAAALPYRDNRFDAVVLQDVIEHVPAPERLLREIRRVLKPGGILYLSTPNRCSILNLAADPHWGLPIVAALPRRAVRRLLHGILRREPDRTDFAQLFALPALRRLLVAQSLVPRLRQRAAARELFERPERIIWSSLHRAMLSVSRMLRLRAPLERCANDAPGFFNRWIAPAWYIVCTREL